MVILYDLIMILWTTTFATKLDPNPELGLEILLPFPDTHQSAVSTPGL